MTHISNRILRLIAAMFVALAGLAACSSAYRDTGISMRTQPIDPEQYLGLWYEIARFPVSFQEGCVGTTAEYGRIDEETISVRNTCRDGTLDGPKKTIEGTAEIAGPGELTVRFNSVPFVAAPYWVLWTDDAYQTAVVGVPSGGAGWILARTPQISQSSLDTALNVLRANGYDTDKLFFVPQPPSE